MVLPITSTWPDWTMYISLPTSPFLQTISPGRYITDFSCKTSSLRRASSQSAKSLTLLKVWMWTLIAMSVFILCGKQSIMLFSSIK